MGEVFWVSLFGLALAWLQSHSQDEEATRPPPEEDRWARWEEEIHDWRDQ